MRWRNTTSKFKFGYTFSIQKINLAENRKYVRFFLESFSKKKYSRDIRKTDSFSN